MAGILSGSQPGPFAFQVLPLLQRRKPAFQLYRKDGNYSVSSLRTCLLPGVFQGSVLLEIQRPSGISIPLGIGCKEIAITLQTEQIQSKSQRADQRQACIGAHLPEGGLPQNCGLIGVFCTVSQRKVYLIGNRYGSLIPDVF